MTPLLLRTSLIGVLLVTQLVPAWIVVQGMRSDAEAVLRADTDRTLERLADRVVQQTRSWLEPADTTLRTVARASRDGAFDAGDDRAVERYLISRIMFQPWLDGLYLGRPDGSFVMVNRAEDGLRTKRIVIDIDDDRERARRVSFVQRDDYGMPLRSWVDADDAYDPRVRPWYAAARRAKDGIGWTDPYLFFSSGRPGITASTTLSGTNGEELGVLGTDIDMDRLSRFVAEVPETAAGSAMIIDGAGRAVAYSDPARWSQTGPASVVPSVEEIGDPALATLFAGPGHGGATSGAVQHLESAGAGFVGLEREFSPTGSDADEMNWSLLVQTPSIERPRGFGGFFAEGTAMAAAVQGISALLAVVAIILTTRPFGRIHRDATVDSLTGAWNRVEFERRLGRSVAARRRRDQNELLVVVALDLDGFKAINDGYGHASGDAVLAGVVERLRSRVRDRDAIGRLGGDEFALALRVEPTTDFVKVVERLRADITDEPVATPRGPCRIGMTAGIAVHERQESVEHTLRRADEALVAGKAREKNRCWLAPPEREPDPRRLCVRTRSRAGDRNGSRIAAP